MVDFAKKALEMKVARLEDALRAERENAAMVLAAALAEAGVNIDPKRYESTAVLFASQVLLHAREEVSKPSSAMRDRLAFSLREFDGAIKVARRPIE